MRVWDLGFQGLANGLVFRVLGFDLGFRDLA